MKTFKILLAAIIFAGFTTSAMAQETSVDQTVNASAAVIDAIEIAKNLDVNFGAVERGVTVSIDVEQTEPSITDNGGLGGDWSFGEIEVTATEGVSFQVNWPGAFNLENTTGDGEMEFTPSFAYDDEEYSNGAEVFGSDGVDVFRIGGSLVVGANQEAGQYEGSFVVTAEYN